MRVRRRGQRIERGMAAIRCVYFREGQRADWVCSFMDTYGVCHYLHTDMFEGMEGKKRRTSKVRKRGKMGSVQMKAAAGARTLFPQRPQRNG